MLPRLQSRGFFMVPALYTLVFVSLCIALAYAGLQFWFVQSWGKTADFLPFPPEPGTAPLRVSVLIPARNEANKLPGLLSSIILSKDKYNLLEIIVLDDFSEDETAALALRFPMVRVIKMADVLPPVRQYFPNKKQAINIGVAEALGELVVTTDADCRVPPQWLSLIGQAFAQNPELQALSGPVAFEEGHTWLQRFQALDFSGMMGITGAGYFSNKFFMANGANLAYRKSAFEAVGAYDGNMHIASGDDMFLMQKMAERYPKGTGFLKHAEATVMTEAAPDWPSFWQQRMRWGSKNTALPNGPLRLALVVAFLHCCLLLILLPCACWTGSVWLWSALFTGLVLKAWSDYHLLASMCVWFGRKGLMRWFWPSFFIHIVYVASVGTASLLIKKYTWKGRKG